MLEFDPQPVIKKSLNMAVFFWSHDGAEIHCHGCCLVTDTASDLPIIALISERTLKVVATTLRV